MQESEKQGKTTLSTNKNFESKIIDLTEKEIITQYKMEIHIAPHTTSLSITYNRRPFRLYIRDNLHEKQDEKCELYSR